jgi:hypothetical protein
MPVAYNSIYEEPERRTDRRTSVKALQELNFVSFLPCFNIRIVTHWRQSVWPIHVLFHAPQDVASQTDLPVTGNLSYKLHLK